MLYVCIIDSARVMFVARQVSGSALAGQRPLVAGDGEVDGDDVDTAGGHRSHSEAAVAGTLRRAWRPAARPGGGRRRAPPLHGAADGGAR